MEKHEKQLRRDAKLLGPILQIGKNGLTQGSIDLIDRELEQKQLVKIRVLKAALPEGAEKADRKKFAAEIAKKTHSQLVEQIGNILVLYRG